jgi:hypothetical protein
MFDVEYFNKLVKFINSKENIAYKFSDLTDDPVKLEFHLKYYIDHIPRTEGFLEIELNSLKFGETTHTGFRVLEFFETIIKRNNERKTKI